MFALELALHPEDGARLKRRLGKGRGTGTRLAMLWHDTQDGALAAEGLALAERRQGREAEWRLERMRPADDAVAPAGTPETILAQAADPASLDALLATPLPGPLLPVAGFDGRLRALSVPADSPGVLAMLLEGTLRAAAGTHPVCRLTLSGEAGTVTALALDLAGELRLAVPPLALSAEAMAVAGRPPAPRRLGAPRLPEGLSVGEAFAFACAHLADVIQHYAPLAVAGGDTEPVHQMRVAARRLGSSIGLFRRAVACPELDDLRDGMKALREVLAPARDWDVFVTGTGRAVGAQFPGDAGMTRLLAAAARRQAEGYTALRAYFAEAGFRRLGIRLAALAAAPPWHSIAAEGEDADKQAAALASELGDFAAHALHRRLRHLLEPGDTLDGLDAAALHRVRLRAKRLRYAIEVFAPLYPRREVARFIRRVSLLQERLGRLNDGAVATALMAGLGAAGGRSFAAGAVCGFVAARSMGARGKIDRGWRRLRRLEPFWE